ncbi:hypothetical protein ABZR86_12160 [Dyella marensis]|uniref:Uncharacterized protein n=1 Tax=Dyella marensis TaxID=500610 RepID=A0A1I2GV70_9GAMM|nr:MULTISPECIES: hypothetical protein [Dyella]SFF21565.1 hypothetical protein SAMN02799615_02767 [Dyella marensis]
MSLDEQQGIAPPAQTQQVPLHFKRHNFEAQCYDTIGCSVAYNGRYQVQKGADEVSPPKPAGDNRKAWGSTELGIRNFPAPAEVRWKSKDGSAHEAQVDIARIFKDELIWHKVPKAEMADFYEGPVAGAPDIYLEVDDRTINVYTAMFIPTRNEQIPGNKDSDFRKDIFLVWSKTY